jgi:hypothetical protein
MASIIGYKKYRSVKHIMMKEDLTRLEEGTCKERQKKDELLFRRLELITLTSHIILILQPTNKTYLCFPMASSS